MPQRWLALPEGDAPAIDGARVALVTDAAALPFPEASLDLVVLPHTLELSADPHQVLREVERVLVPEGWCSPASIPRACGPAPGARAPCSGWAGARVRTCPRRKEFIGRPPARLVAIAELQMRPCGYNARGAHRQMAAPPALDDRAGAGGRSLVRCVTTAVRGGGMRLLGPASAAPRAGHGAGPWSTGSGAEALAVARGGHGHRAFFFFDGAFFGPRGDLPMAPARAIPPRRLGRLSEPGHEKTVGRRARHHEQPHGTHGVIQALSALKAPSGCFAWTAIRAQGHHRMDPAGRAG